MNRFTPRFEFGRILRCARLPKCGRRPGRAKRSNNHPRRGAAVMEVAVTAPVFLFLFFGFWEYSRCEMIRQTAAIAAFEGARQGTIAGATQSDVRDVANRILGRATLTHVTVKVDQKDDSTTVLVEVPLDKNAWIAPLFFKKLKIRSEFELTNTR